MIEKAIWLCFCIHDCSLLFRIVISIAKPHSDKDIVLTIVTALWLTGYHFIGSNGINIKEDTFIFFVSFR